LEHAPRHPDHVEGRLHAELHIRLRYFCSPYHQDSALFPFVSDRSTKAVLEVMARGQRRFVHDSPLEGGVTCELVSGNPDFNVRKKENGRPKAKFDQYLDLV
jgi:hypothetical protein